MARTRRRDTISDYHRDQIERQCFKLQVEMDAAKLALKPFYPHWEAIDELRVAMKKATNLLNDWPADYERPHAAPMSGGTPPPPKTR